MDRIQAINRSIRCFVLGLFGLLPVIGIPMAVLALREHRCVMRGMGEAWNPARRYLVCGAICARWGLLVPFFALLAIGAILLIRASLGDGAA